MDFSQLSINELLDRGDVLLEQLQHFTDELDKLTPEIQKHKAELDTAGLKLGLGSVATVGGAVAAPFTMGLSLFFTLLGGGLTIWEAREYVKSRSDLNSLIEKATGIRRAAADAADELEEIHREIESRA